MFVGPPEHAMWALGDKIASSIVAQTAGVPTLPWSGSGLLIINWFSYKLITSTARDNGGARYCNQFVHNVLNSSEFAPTINSRRQMPGSPPNLHTMDSMSACIQRAQGQGQGQRSRDTGTFVLARKKSLLLARKWTDCDQICTRWSPGKSASMLCSRSRSRSKVTWYGHFCAGRKIASSPTQMTGSRRRVCNLTFLPLQ